GGQPPDSRSGNRHAPLFCKLFSVATLSTFLSNIISFRRRLLSPRLRQHQSSDVSLHIWSGRAGVHPRPARRAFHAQYDSEHPANPSRVPRVQARSSAPVNYVPRPECRQSLPGHSSTELLPLYAAQNSASSVCASSPERTRRAVVGNRPAPVTSTSPIPFGVLCGSVD